MMKNKRQPVNPIVIPRILPALVLLFHVCSTRADDRKHVLVPATIEIPPGTRSVVISPGAGNKNPVAVTSEHYVDAINVRLVDAVEPLD